MGGVKGGRGTSGSVSLALQSLTMGNKDFMEIENATDIRRYEARRYGCRYHRRTGGALKLCLLTLS